MQRVAEEGETIRRSASSPSFFFCTFLSLHGWRRRIFLSAWHTWHRKGTNSFVKTHTGSTVKNEISAGENTTVLHFACLPCLCTCPALQLQVWGGKEWPFVENLCVALCRYSTCKRTLHAHGHLPECRVDANRFRALLSKNILLQTTNTKSHQPRPFTKCILPSVECHHLQPGAC